MEFEIGCKLILKDISRTIAKEIKSRLTIPNPKFQQAEKMGRYTGNIEPELHFYQENANGLECPRGFARQAWRICEQHGEHINVVDRRRVLPPVDFQFLGKLRNYQETAVDTCLKRQSGLLSSPTGSGKTTMALYIVSARRQPTLVIVHTKELLDQWRERIKQFLGIEAGIIGGGVFDIQPVTVATIQTLVKHAEDVAGHFGHVVFDECHRAPAMQYVKAIEHFDCKYITGLSATPYRRDGLSKVIFWYLGDVAGQVEKGSLVDNGQLCPAEVAWIETDFNPSANATEQYSKALSELAEDEARNSLIAKAVAENNGHGISLILSDRKAHCETIAALLEDGHGITAEVLTGGTGKAKRRQILDDLQRGRCRYLVATGQLIGEGFDLPAISSLFLATPVKYHGRLIQYIGRALRPVPGKEKAHIYDFVDINNPVFQASAKSRKRAYQEQGIGQFSYT